MCLSKGKPLTQNTRFLRIPASPTKFATPQWFSVLNCDHLVKTAFFNPLHNLFWYDPTQAKVLNHISGHIKEIRNNGQSCGSEELNMMLTYTKILHYLWACVWVRSWSYEQLSRWFLNSAYPSMGHCHGTSVAWAQDVGWHQEPLWCQHFLVQAKTKIEVV